MWTRVYEFHQERDITYAFHPCISPVPLSKQFEEGLHPVTYPPSPPSGLGSHRKGIREIHCTYKGTGPHIWRALKDIRGFPDDAKTGAVKVDDDDIGVHPETKVVRDMVMLVPSGEKKIKNPTGEREPGEAVE